MLVAGLGNPGPRYRFTRHNAGFLVVDQLTASQTARQLQLSRMALVWELPKDLYAVQPLTYMNRSGVAIACLARELGLKPEEILVVHDDMDLSFGRLRLRPGGGSGGHNGIASIIEQLGTSDFPRLRIGIGRPAQGEPVVDYVLNPFPREEWDALDQVLQRAVEAVICWRDQGIETAMNRFNTKINIE